MRWLLRWCKRPVGSKSRYQPLGTLDSWFPNHGDGLEGANYLTFLASGTGIDIRYYGVLDPSLWLQTEEVERANRNAPSASSASIGRDIW
jgi:hypothetical protein